MIRSFACKETEKLFNDESSRRLQPDIHTTARRKLLWLQQARTLNDLKSPPNNHLEAYKRIEKDNTAFALIDNGESVFAGMKVMPVKLKLWIITKGNSI